METPNIRIIIEGAGDSDNAFRHVDALREVLAEQDFDVHSIRVEASAE